MRQMLHHNTNAQQHARFARFNDPKIPLERISRTLSALDFSCVATAGDNHDGQTGIPDDVLSGYIPLERGANGLAIERRLGSEL